MAEKSGCNTACARKCPGCGAEKPIREFYSGKGLCKPCHNARYSLKAGYRSPSGTRILIAHFVERMARAAMPRICEKCGFIGPATKWPKTDGTPAHYRCYCASCDAQHQEDRPNGRKAARVDGQRVCAQCKTAKPTDEFLWLPSKGKWHPCCNACRPQLKRKQTERRATTAGRVAAAYMSQVERNRQAAMGRVERRADRLRARHQRASEGEWRRAWWQEYKHSAEYLEQEAANVKRAYWANPERARHAKRIYKAAHPEKDAATRGKRGKRLVETADGSLLPTTLSRMYDRAENCAYCGKAMPSVSDKSLDHFVPLALGGRHSVANVVICCLDCNLSKNRTHPLIWLGIDEFERWVAKLRTRGAGEPALPGKLYPETQEAAA